MAPENGMINCSLGDDGIATYREYTCTVTCNDGFMLCGDATRMCQINGNKGRMDWSGNQASCVPGMHGRCK